MLKGELLEINKYVCVITSLVSTTRTVVYEPLQFNFKVVLSRYIVC